MPRQPKQQDVTTAIAAALAALKPAVDAGLFSNSAPPTRLTKFFLKFSMTSLRDHREPSWDETAFHYDDARGQSVIAKAGAGDAVAYAMLREIARARLPKGLPPNLAEFLLAEQSKPDGRKDRRRFDRDVYIYYAVEEIIQLSYAPTRNPSTEHHELACSIVVTALKELGVKMPEKTVEGIRQAIQQTIPANLF